jgi:predicted O-linked N-acetylglucosamine transferase (SPINDLY family)
MNQPLSSMTQQMLQAFAGQDLGTAERLSKMVLKLKPKDLVALQVHGLSLAMQGRLVESVAPLLMAVAQDQNNPELLSNLAKSQHGAKLYADATQTYKKLDKLLPQHCQILTDMGTNYAKLKNYDEASQLFERAIQINSEYFLTWSNQGNLLSELGFMSDALISYEKALSLNSNYPETWTNYGNALFDMGRFQEARLAHEKSLSLNPDYAEAWSNYGNTLSELKDSGGYEAYKKAYSLKPEHPFLIGQLLMAAASRYDWIISEEISQKVISVTAELGEAAHPFVLLQTTAPAQLQKLSAQTFIKKYASNFPANSIPIKLSTETKEKIRIGYFSSDFKDHPVGVLMENVLRCHDRSKFEIYGFCLNAATGDSQEQKLKQLMNQTINIFGLDSDAALELIRAQQLDIAIDLNGHTSGARTALFARKLAPIQVNYLGYAGTSGADFYDALIADQLVIPPESQVHFSEKIFYLPNSFFPVDTSIPYESFGEVPSRVSQGLPESGIVFACFNNAYKITPAIFTIWMNLLKVIPGSVLWLSKPSTAEAIANLQNEAVSRGVDSSRLVFASRTPGRKEHLSRLRLADLFLDTPHYNAHATAADALWAGLPLLTLIGETFAGRVAASQLNVLGLNQLIVDSEQKYFDKAVELASKPELLKNMRYLIEANRSSSPLFDTKKYAKDLEAIYLGLIEHSS